LQHSFLQGTISSIPLFLFKKARDMVDISPHPLQAQISALKVEHRQVKDIIQELESSQNFNSLALKRYKKKKLCLKDSIHKLENDMLPDIIA